MTEWAVYTTFQYAFKIQVHFKYVLKFQYTAGTLVKRVLSMVTSSPKAEDSKWLLQLKNWGNHEYDLTYDTPNCQDPTVLLPPLHNSHIQ